MFVSDGGAWRYSGGVGIVVDSGDVGECCRDVGMVVDGCDASRCDGDIR